MSSLILGTATGYPPSVIERFAKSARDAGITSRIILCTDTDSAPHYQHTASQYAIELLQFSNLPYHIQTARHLLYQELLERHLSMVEHILLCDVRDLFFVQDPFGHPCLGLHPLHCFMEDQLIGRCRYNSAWIEYAFGPQLLQRLAPLPISCSGTTIGSRSAIITYLGRINGIAQKLHAAGREIVCGLDQGIHNALLHTQQLADLSPKLWTNSDRYIFTMGYATYQLSSRGVPLPLSPTPATEEPYILHQFDRMQPADLNEFAQRMGCWIGDLEEHPLRTAAATSSGSTQTS